MNLSTKQDKVMKRFSKGDIDHLLLEGAVGTGKTLLIVIIFILEVMKVKGKGYDCIICGASRSTIIRNFISPMEDIVGKAIKIDKWGKFELFGNSIHVFEGKNRDSFKKVRGMNSAVTMIGELTTLDKNFVEEVMDRTRKGNAITLSDTNPDLSTHWVKKEYIDKSGEKLANGRVGIMSFKFTIDDNPFLPESYKLRLKSRYPVGSCLHERKINGNWVDETEASIYGLYMKQLTRIKEVELSNLYVALDLGVADCTVLTFGVKTKDKQGNDILNVIHHYAKSGQPTLHFINYIIEYCRRYNFGYKNVQIVLPHDSAKREDNISTLVSRYNVYAKIFPRTIKISPIKQMDMINNTRGKLYDFVKNESKIHFLDDENMDAYISKLKAYSWVIESNGVINERMPEHGKTSDSPSNYADSFEYMVYYALGFEDVESIDKVYYDLKNINMNY